MKIEITTQREILDCDYWDWITELKRNGIPIDGTELEESKSFTWKTDAGYTKAITTYKIIQEE